MQVPVAFPSKLIVRDQINWLVLGDSDHLGRVERIPLCYLSDKSRKHYAFAFISSDNGVTPGEWDGPLVEAIHCSRCIIAHYIADKVQRPSDKQIFDFKRMLPCV